MRLPMLIPGSTTLTTFRQRAVAAVGAIGLLALSGSQAVSPGAGSVAFLKVHQAEPKEGESYYYDPTWPGAANGSPVQALEVAPANGPKPYGLTTSATFTASGIPQPAYRAYVNAASELAHTDPSCHLNWSLIAGIGRVESNHGRYGGSTIRTDGLVTPPILGLRLDGSRPGTARISDSDGGRYDGDPVYDRAVGPMQFLPGTWKIYGAGANPQNMNAAALATGRYLCAGTGSLATQQGRWAAVYRYNHSDSYVSLVLSIADSYASGHVTSFPSRPAGTPAPDKNAPSATPAGPPPSVPSSGTPSTPSTPPNGTPSIPVVRPTDNPVITTPTTPSTTNPPDPTPTPSNEPTTADPTPTPTPSDSPTPTDPTAGGSTPADSTAPTAP